MQTQIIKQATAVATLAPTAIPQKSLGVPSHEHGSRTAKQITSQIRNSPVFPTSATCKLTRFAKFRAARIKNTTHTPSHNIKTVTSGNTYTFHRPNMDVCCKCKNISFGALSKTSRLTNVAHGIDMKLCFASESWKRGFKSFLPFDLLPFTIKTSVISLSRGMPVQIKSTSIPCISQGGEVLGTRQSRVQNGYLIAKPDMNCHTTLYVRNIFRSGNPTAIFRKFTQGIRLKNNRASRRHLRKSHHVK